MIRNLLQKINSVILLFLFLFLFLLKGYTQEISFKEDLTLVDSALSEKAPNTVNRPYIFKDQKKTFKNSNPVSLFYGGSLFVYQNVFSQHLSASCLFEPSCSDFSKKAVKEFGLLKGTLLSFDRLSRCNRIAATDLKFHEIDPKTHRFHDAIKNYK